MAVLYQSFGLQDWQKSVNTVHIYFLISFICRYMTSSLKRQSYEHCKLFFFLNRIVTIIMVIVVVDHVLFRLIISHLFLCKANLGVILNRRPEAKLQSQSTANLFFLPVLDILHNNFKVTMHMHKSDIKLQFKLLFSVRSTAPCNPKVWIICRSCFAW